MMITSDHDHRIYCAVTTITIGTTTATATTTEGDRTTIVTDTAMTNIEQTTIMTGTTTTAMTSTINDINEMIDGILIEDRETIDDTTIIVVETLLKTNRSSHPPPPTDRGDTSNSASVTCFKCNQPGHYATQCPTTDRGKAPAVNSIMADVQQVTTHSKTQATQWQVQDEVRTAAKEWIDTANKTNFERIQTEMQDVTIGAPSSTRPSTSAEDDHLWNALTSSRISLPFHKLLPLMPRFRDTWAMLTSDTKSAASPVNLTEPGTGPPLMDSQNPSVKIIIKGRDLHGCIIDGGSGVNVISEATCHNLGLNQCEPCPF